MRKHLIIVVTVALGALTAVAFAQDPSPEDSRYSVALGEAPSAPPALPAGAWEVTITTIRTNCPGQAVRTQAAYTGTLSRGPGGIVLETPTSPNWKRFRAELIGSRVALTAYQDGAAVRERAHASTQLGVFHAIIQEWRANELAGYGFRSTWLPPANSARGGICDESLAVQLRKL